MAVSEAAAETAGIIATKLFTFWSNFFSVLSALYAAAPAGHGGRQINLQLGYGKQGVPPVQALPTMAGTGR